MNILVLGRMSMSNFCICKRLAFRQSAFEIHYHIRGAPDHPRQLKWCLPSIECMELVQGGRHYQFLRVFNPYKWPKINGQLGVLTVLTPIEALFS